MALPICGHRLPSTQCFRYRPGLDRTPCARCDHRENLTVCAMTCVGARLATVTLRWPGRVPSRRLPLLRLVAGTGCVATITRAPTFACVGAHHPMLILTPTTLPAIYGKVLQTRDSAGSGYMVVMGGKDCHGGSVCTKATIEGALMIVTMPRAAHPVHLTLHVAALGARRCLAARIAPGSLVARSIAISQFIST